MMTTGGAVSRSSTVNARTLRILSLNLWGGMVLDPLLAYIRERAPQTDIFCFQEALDAPEPITTRSGFRATLMDDLVRALPDFDGCFSEMVSWVQTTDDGRPLTVPFGVATFARRTLPLADRHAVTIVEHDDTLESAPGRYRVVRPAQLTRLEAPDGSLLVANFHGIARPGHKLDSEDRLTQSRELRRVLSEHAGPVVLIGDFNLLPETESVRLLEAGYRNLVIERAIPTTRSRLNPFRGTPEEQRHADYAFVSPALTVTDLQVPDVEVSDHLPLLLTVAW
jgi:endonuclease/exonuclease/phosphatase family metal-dependent hydrolase